MCIYKEINACKGIGTSDGKALTCPNTLTKSKTSFQSDQTGNFQKKAMKTVVLCRLAAICININAPEHPGWLILLVNVFMQEKISTFHRLIFFFTFD